MRRNGYMLRMFPKETACSGDSYMRERGRTGGLALDLYHFRNTLLLSGSGGDGQTAQTAARSGASVVGSVCSDTFR